MNEKQTIDEIKKTSLKMIEGKDSSKTAFLYLRKIIRPIELYEVYKNWSNDENKFLLYFLKTFLDDVWRNLAVDTPFEVKEDKIIQLSKRIGENIRQIIQDLENNSTGKNYKSLSHTIAPYFELLREFDECE